MDTSRSYSDLAGRIACANEKPKKSHLGTNLNSWSSSIPTRSSQSLRNFGVIQLGLLTTSQIVNAPTV
jgi:hypothetical protein